MRENNEFWNFYYIIILIVVLWKFVKLRFIEFPVRPISIFTESPVCQISIFTKYAIHRIHDPEANPDPETDPSPNSPFDQKDIYC